jgi:hypothetical protein
VRFLKSWQVLIIVASSWNAACNVDDTGKLCGEPNVTLASTPVVGEVPVITVVDITRDSNCLTFQCLTHEGLPSYCTRTCKYNTPAQNANSCSADSGCSPPLHCQIKPGDSNGVCNDDDCPAGFSCEEVAAVGPLAGTNYCTRQTECQSELDCGDVGNVTCATLGCFGACLYDPSTCGTAPNPLTCVSETALNCTCTAPNTALNKCSAANLSCTPPNTQTFPAGSVTPLPVCLGK